MKYLYLSILLISVFTLMSCGDDEVDQADVEAQFATDINLIENYLKSKNLVAEKTAQGVYYIIDEPGSAEKPKVTNIVRCNYKGYFLDGVVFDSGNNSEFGLFEVIQGWTIGIPKFGKGGKGKLLIPSKYAYQDKTAGSGANARTNAVVIFDVELIDFKAGAAQPGM